MPYTKSRARQSSHASHGEKVHSNCPTLSQHGILSMVGTFTVIFAIIATTAEASEEPHLQPVNLPYISAQRAAPLDESFVVTVAATDIGDGNLPPPNRSSSESRQCLVFLEGSEPVDSSELYDRAFDRLDRFVMAHFPTEGHMYSDYYAPQEVSALPFLIRADGGVPWRCVAGVIYIGQVAGYPQVSLLTRPESIR